MCGTQEHTRESMAPGFLPSFIVENNNGNQQQGDGWYEDRKPLDTSLLFLISLSRFLSASLILTLVVGGVPLTLGRFFCSLAASVWRSCMNCPCVIEPCCSEPQQAPHLTYGFHPAGLPELSFQLLEWFGMRPPLLLLYSSQILPKSGAIFCGFEYQADFFRPIDDR